VKAFRKFFARAITAFAIFGGLTGVALADTIQDALVAAYNSNPQLKAEQARLRSVDENYIQARAQSRPTITLNGTAAGSAVRTPFSFGPVQGAGPTVITGTPIAGQIEVLQPVYQGGRLKAQRRQALTQILAARENLRQIEQDVLLAAALAYLDVLRDEQTAHIRRNNVRVLSRQKEAAQIRFDVGEGTLTDTAQADSRLAAAEIGLASADAQLASSRAVFRRTVGRDPISLTPAPRLIVPNTPAEALEIALGNNPAISAARHNLEAQKYNVNIARSATKPSVSLSGTVAAQREQILGFSQAEAAIKYEIKDAELELSQNIYQLWAQIDAAERTLVASERQIQAAKLAFEGVQLEQDVGTRTVLDVLDAEQEVLNAEINYISTRRELDAALFRLLAAMGTFTSSGLQLPVNIYDPDVSLNDNRSDILHNIASQRLPSLVNESVFEPVIGAEPVK